MTTFTNWVEDGATSPTLLVAMSSDTTLTAYNGQLGFASRYVATHFRLSPVLAPTVAALAGLGGGA